MSFAGFDTSAFPGLAMMARLKAETNLVWTGYYFPSPSHDDDGWIGQRALLQAMGFGVKPIYVGQQITGPGSHNASAAQGTIDALDAANWMVKEGFAPGSSCALDIENGAPYCSPMSDYANAWVTGFEAAGWRAEVYCSHDMAADAAAQTSAGIWAFNVPTISRTEAVAPFLTPDVSGCGFAGACAWQRRQNVLLTDFGVVVDLSVSTVANPGAPSSASNAA